jgi:hypothetical protein
MRHLITALSLCVIAQTGDAQHQDVAAPGDNVGKVHFRTSCSPAVEARFNHAVALLHSFEFGESIKGFHAVLNADSTCAMAYWGLALSQWSNPMAAGARSKDQLSRGLALVDSALLLSPNETDRERGYIEAVAQLYRDFEHRSQAERVAAYERSMDSLVFKQPADTEAMIFHALSLVASASPTDKSYKNQKKAGQILRSLWAKQPNHPGIAHYLIHAYDYPALADEGRPAASGYASIAPSTPHALHMPSHIFTRVGLWERSIGTNLKSMSAAQSMGSIAEALHAADYAEYAYLQIRQVPRAKEILDGLPALAARFDPKAITGAAPGSAGVFALAAIPARYALERDSWREAAGLEVKRSDFPWTDAMTYFARAIGSARIRNFGEARKAIDSLESIRDALSGRKEAYWSEQVAIQALSARAWLDLGDGRVDSALARMKEAVTREDATEKDAVTPGPLYPAREMLGDMLIQLHRPRSALAEYQRALIKEPNRYRSLVGAERAARSAGDKATAKKMRSKILVQTKHMM